MLHHLAIRAPAEVLADGMVEHDPGVPDIRPVEPGSGIVLPDRDRCGVSACGDRLCGDHAGTPADWYEEVAGALDASAMIDTPAYFRVPSRTPCTWARGERYRVP